MKNKKSIFIGFLFIALIITSLIAGARYNSYEKYKINKAFYLNQIYYEMDGTITLLSSIEDWGDRVNSTDFSINPYSQLLAKLDTMKIINKQTQLYFREDNYSYILNVLADSFDLIERGVGSGIIAHNQLICYDFLKDGVLSNNEKAFLNSLKADLKNIKGSMYSERTGQENQDLSMQELQQIFKPFTDKYSIINETNIGLKN